MARFYYDKKGYPRFRDSGTLVHRWKAEKKLDRPLKAGEVVHHINRKKSDYSAQNLWIFKSQDEHERAHKRDKKKTGFW